MAVMDQPLAQELAAFEAKRQELLASAANKFALVKGSELVDTFDTAADALSAGYAKFGMTPFLVKQILPLDPQIQISSFMAGLR